MANKLQIKRTSVSGRVPDVSNTSSTSYIDQGELAINTADGILYSSNGTELIEVGSNNTNVSITDTLTLGGGNITINTNAISLNAGVGSTLTGNGNIQLFGNTTGLGSRGSIFITGNGGTKGHITLSNGAFCNIASGTLTVTNGANSFLVNSAGTEIYGEFQLSYGSGDLYGGRVSFYQETGPAAGARTYLSATQTVSSTIREIFLPQANGTIALTSDLSTYLENIVEDTTPQLGGNLDMNGNIISSNVAIGDQTTTHRFAFNTVYDGASSYGYDVNVTGLNFSGAYGRFFAEGLSFGDEGIYIEGFDDTATNGINIGFTRSGNTGSVGEGSWTTCPNNAVVGAFNWYVTTSTFTLKEVAKFQTTLVGSANSTATANVSLSISDSGTLKVINFPRVTGQVPVVSSTPTDGQFIEYNANTGAFDPVDAPAGGGGITTGKAIAMAIVFG